MLYRVVSILYPSFNSSLDGFSVDIFFSGCKFKCKGCHNSELWEFIEPNINIKKILEAIATTHKSEIVTLMGGEPLQQFGILELIQELKKIKKYVSLYTGYDFNDISQKIKDKVDYIKTGRYKEENKLVGEFLSSSNQVMWKKTKYGTWEKQWFHEISKEEGGSLAWAIK